MARITGPSHQPWPEAEQRQDKEGETGTEATGAPKQQGSQAALPLDSHQTNPGLETEAVCREVTGHPPSSSGETLAS